MGASRKLTILRGQIVEAGEIWPLRLTELMNTCPGLIPILGELTGAEEGTRGKSAHV
jgi:hypothetical protein